MDIHTRIRQCREALNMSRAELAQRVGVAWQTVQSWERDASHPKVYRPNKKVLSLLAEALRVDVAYLLTGINANVPDQQIALIKRYIPELKDAEGRVIDFTNIQAIGDRDDTFPYRCDWLRARGLIAEDCRVAEVHDDEMYTNGQLLIDTTKDRIKDGKLYLILTTTGFRARYVHLFNGNLALRTDKNPSPQFAAPDSMTIVGRVVACTNFLE